MWIPRPRTVVLAGIVALVWPAALAAVEFEHTPNAAISGHNKVTLEQVSVDACKRACEAATDFVCISFDYRKSDRVCYLSDKAAIEVGGLKRDYPGNPYDHYARKTLPDGDLALANVGESCKLDADCHNSACGRKTGSSDSLVCCASGETVTTDFRDFCTEMSDGTTCLSDSMCSSGYCRENHLGLVIGTCAPSNLPAGESCTANQQCANDACGRKSALEGADLVCCPSGRVGTYAGYDYCLDMPLGSRCWSDAQCASGTCADNMGGLRRGRCR